MVQDGRFLLPLSVVTGLLFFRGITFPLVGLDLFIFFQATSAVRDGLF